MLLDVRETADWESGRSALRELTGIEPADIARQSGPSGPGTASGCQACAVPGHPSQNRDRRG
ncbi:hypothetical protein [Streptomyces sp. 891-h]|uniref:hypothetical protein n=1 Tax=Streptomyces sp. 891-h TaxID=2720714 RepID=UPI001FA9938D|nr:hypothetical protein [Streptomyces sp. 891-h]UNZ21234.1 hypothetical protein HC362_33320 [Streptomyces sp. 891-h]